MIPPGLVAAIYAWAISPEVSDAEHTTRANAILAERDAIVAGKITNGGKSVRELVSGTVNGKAFSILASLPTMDKLTVITAVLDRLGLVAEEAQPVTVTHAVFGCLQR